MADEAEPEQQQEQVEEMEAEPEEMEPEQQGEEQQGEEQAAGEEGMGEQEWQQDEAAEQEQQGEEEGMEQDMEQQEDEGAAPSGFEQDGDGGDDGGDGESLLSSHPMGHHPMSSTHSPLLVGTPMLDRPSTYGSGEPGDDIPMANRFESLLSHRTNSASSSRPSRPVSAVIDLRGSRPNSAAIAQEIEGFEDDFMERVEEEEDEQYYDEYDEEDDKGDLGPTVEELVERGQLEQQRLTELNETLQRRARLALDLRNKGRPPVNKDLARLDGVSTRYRSALKLWVDTLEERDRVEGHYQTTIFDMKSMLEERIKRADDISKAYKHFKMEVAKTAEHSKSGRAISEGLLGRLEGEDLEKEEEVQRVRLKNIHLSNQLKRIEQTLRQKEELAEGLHLIDFEQLKIENQSLNEKIEERNEELLNLRKKTTTTVQILTHVREKLQFVEKDNASLGDTLRDLDGQLNEKRDAVGKIKGQRDAARQQGRKIKEASVYITNHTLLDDIEAQKEKREALAAKLEQLQADYEELAEGVARNNARIVSATEEMATGESPRTLHSIKSSVSVASSGNRR